MKSARGLRKPWEETADDFAGRMASVVADINATCDVRGACMSFPERLRKLGRVLPAGDRLKT